MSFEDFFECQRVDGVLVQRCVIRQRLEGMALTLSEHLISTLHPQRLAGGVRRVVWVRGRLEANPDWTRRPPQFGRRQGQGQCVVNRDGTILLAGLSRVSEGVHDHGYGHDVDEFEIRPRRVALEMRVDRLRILGLGLDQLGSVEVEPTLERVAAAG